MLYLIGLGLNEKSISKEGLEAISKCKKIYLEGYTIDFPYSIKDLEKNIKKRVEVLDRNGVEGSLLVKEGKKKDVYLLIYGSPLFATTHMTLVNDCKKAKVKVKIIYNAGVFDAVAETGLQLYKFGKISSMPAWTNDYKPDSFLDYVKENISNEAHSLILIDIGLNFNKALEQLEISAENKKLRLNYIIVCSRLGNDDSKILYGKVGDLKKKKIKNPYCFIIPGKMHFMEKEVVESFGI